MAQRVGQQRGRAGGELAVDGVEQVQRQQDLRAADRYPVPGAGRRGVHPAGGAAAGVQRQRVADGGEQQRQAGEEGGALALAPR
ncbi:hypothetical protein GCM10010123_22060 [Pilimelia anulata]|uniref:Uncharacterized protein n=1 Tax=Pilimelia anulata TaxID=53371 RepID=A0A8J3B9Y1_9ACTN|nr:hypothetical protein GCM10010123_22060 [Pilimelia anulata]